MKKILRNTATEEGRIFWENAERISRDVKDWPAWKRAGINVAPLRSAPREVVAETPPKPDDTTRF